MKRTKMPAFSDALEPRRLLSTYTVTSTADSTSSGTLRWAITQANNSLGVADTIRFSIGSGAKTIALTSSLPVIIDELTIDGTTQPGYVNKPIIEINGSGAGSSGIGFDVLIGYTTVHGVVMNRFGNSAISTTSNGHLVLRNSYIGTNVAGTAALPNAVGLNLATGANLIGGTSAWDRNVISGNSIAGIYIGSGGGNAIWGNYIGTNAAGTAAVPNFDGISTFAANTNIGSEYSGTGNLISGNSNYGVRAVGVSGLLFQQNRVGTNAAGTGELPNLLYGVFLQGVTTATIGGSASSTGAVPPGRNYFVAGHGTALYINGGSGNVVYGNHFGMSANGVDFLSGSGGDSLELVNSNSNAIGSVVIGTSNVFGGGGLNSIRIRGTSASNTVEGNQFGIRAGPVSVWGGPQGVLIEGSGAGNRVGGTDIYQRNVFLNLNGAGVRVQNHTAGGNIAGNIMGSDATLAEIAPMDSGVILDGCSNWIVSKNYLVNNNYGAQLLATTRAATGNRFFSNIIGGDHTLMMGNFDDGVRVDLVSGGSDNQIGTNNGPATIAHNGGAGVRIIRGTGVRIAAQEIFDNGDKGIVLNTANNANNNLAAPVITSAVRSANGSTRVEGTIIGTPGTNYLVDLYRNTAVDPSGFGEGEYWLTTMGVTCNASGVGTFLHIDYGYALGTAFSASVWEGPTNNTSEFSAIRRSVAGGPPTSTSAVFEYELNHTLRVKFDQNVSASLSSSDLQLTNLSTGRNVTGAFFLSTVATSGSTQVTTGIWTFFGTNPLPDGDYRAYIASGNVTNSAGQSLLNSVEFTFHVLAGDVNRDRQVNFDDLLIVAQNYGQSGRTFSQGNLDYSTDGVVAFDDLLLLAQRYGGELVRISPVGVSARRRVLSDAGLA